MNEFPEEIQSVEENHFIEDLSFSPAQTKNFSVSNMVQRSLSHLVGFTAEKVSKVLKCTSNGILQVVYSGSGNEHNETFTGTTAAAYGLPIKPVLQANKVCIWTSSNSMYFKRYNSLLSYDDEILLEKDSYFEFECVTSQMNVKDGVAGSHATYQIVIFR